MHVDITLDGGNDIVGVMGCRLLLLLLKVKLGSSDKYCIHLSSSSFGAEALIFFLGEPWSVMDDEHVADDDDIIPY